MSDAVVPKKSWARPTLKEFGSLETLTGSGWGRPPGLPWGGWGQRGGRGWGGGPWGHQHNHNPCPYDNLSGP
ncbi:hypothetical protein [Rhodothermus profundi]|uniref:Uncharacterized protein n=1 Tax=Rhodothermus profundi TaxID=633813 RepID=A0A1M6VBL9_9BACT|nr:hypothetical protein [Rhodothermus profundi]SHK78892.1 hypothetical protein SAMN04488087_1978 [Rhodothermus profundi]